MVLSSTPMLFTDVEFLYPLAYYPNSTFLWLRILEFCILNEFHFIAITLKVCLLLLPKLSGYNLILFPKSFILHNKRNERIFILFIY